MPVFATGVPRNNDNINILFKNRKNFFLKFKFCNCLTGYGEHFDKIGQKIIV